VEYHEAANIYPLLMGTEFEEFKAAIARDGLKHSIVTLDGKILDGRNRYRACLETDVDPRFVEYDGDQDPVDFVVTENGDRRHLSISQRGLAGGKASRLKQKYAAEAKERQKAGGGDKKSARAKSVVKNSTQPIPAKTRDQVGAAIGVSGNTIEKAWRILDKALPEVGQAVEANQLSINRADKIARLPEEKQKQALEEALRPRSVSPRTTKREKPQTDELPEGELRGVGVFRANEAINCLKRIPKNDRLRKRGFQIVTDWIRLNK